MTNSSSQIRFQSLPKDDPKRRKPNIDMAFTKLNKWFPKTDLDEGLEKTICYYRELNQ